MLHSHRTRWRVSLLPLCVSEEFIGIAVGTLYSRRTVPMLLGNSGPNSILLLSGIGRPCRTAPIFLRHQSCRSNVLAFMDRQIFFPRGRADGGTIRVGVGEGRRSKARLPSRANGCEGVLHHYNANRLS